jgi:hypothetical protein
LQVSKRLTIIVLTKTIIMKKETLLTDKNNRFSKKTTIQYPFTEITCCYLAYGMGDNKWFEFYKGEDMIKNIFSSSYFHALAEFMLWYKDNI